MPRMTTIWFLRYGPQRLWANAISALLQSLHEYETIRDTLLIACSNLGMSQVLVNGGFEIPTVGVGSWEYNPTDPGVGWSGNDIVGFGHWGVANGAGSWGTGSHGGEQYGLIQQ